ncbi:hypothetical protein ACFR96_15870 [Microbulbifer halophilus]|uniref:Uncharacterized protein n=1 Tax=Microbulbifer halophilus TaxID=453963 RepID=A0ABW5EJ10_9GAMM|nr:hypothetical protein [Microbulbifer halophilus]MCW8127832.1 hypothetical protein [Microbulbifer halophilus]
MKIFEVVHEGFPALVSYTCKDGKISIQTVNISYSKDSEAKQKIKDLEREYTNKYESSPDRDVDNDSAWLVWRSDKALVTVSALYSGEGSEVYINHGAP